MTEARSPVLAMFSAQTAAERCGLDASRPPAQRAAPERRGVVETATTCEARTSGERGSGRSSSAREHARGPVGCASVLIDRTGTRVRARRAPWAAAAAEGGACRWRRRLSRRTRRTSSTARTRRAMTRTRTSGCVRRPLSSPPRHSPRARIRHARDRPRPPRARRDRTHGGAARAPGRRRTRRFRTRVRGRPTDDARPSRSVPRIAPLEIGSLTNTLSVRGASLRASDRKRRRSTCATSRIRPRT